MTKPSFIYFDVGGVLIRDLTQRDNKRELIKELGISYFQAYKLDKLYDQYEPDFCRGEYSDGEIKAMIEDKLKVKLPDSLSVLETIISFFAANNSIHQVLHKLATTTRLGLLTNMNLGMLDLIKEKGLLPEISWEVVVDSSLVGFAKPQKEIYQYAQAQLDLPPEEILFIDNLQKNLPPAQELGWQTFCYSDQDFEGSTAKLKEHLAL